MDGTCHSDGDKDQGRSEDIPKRLILQFVSFVSSRTNIVEAALSILEHGLSLSLDPPKL